MRIITTKVYRAFPELDRFPDDRCQAFVSSARRRRWLSGVLLAPIIAGVVVLGGVLLTVLCVGVVEDVLPGARRGRGEIELLIAGCCFVISVSAGLLMRDVWLRWAVRGQLVSTKCPGCRYLLLGLPIRAGVVVCPECGHRVVLEEVGMSPADLMAQPEMPVSDQLQRSTMNSVQPLACLADTPTDACSPGFENSSPSLMPTSTQTSSTSGL